VLSGDLAAALESQRREFDWRVLVLLGKLTESNLYELPEPAQKVSFEQLDLPTLTARSPALFSSYFKKWKVLGYKVAAGQLFELVPTRRPSR